MFDLRVDGGDYCRRPSAFQTGARGTLRFAPGGRLPTGTLHHTMTARSQGQPNYLNGEDAPCRAAFAVSGTPHEALLPNGLIPAVRRSRSWKVALSRRSPSRRPISFPISREWLRGRTPIWSTPGAWRWGPTAGC